MFDLFSYSDVKECSKCFRVKYLVEFSKSKSAKGGLQERCKECDRKYYEENRKIIAVKKSAYRETNKEQLFVKRAANRQQLIEYNKQYNTTISGRTKRLLSSAKKRAIKKDVEFTLTSQFVELKLMKGVCEKSGVAFDLSVADEMHRNPFAPSLDRIDNSMGYTESNTQLVCNLYNQGKGECSDEAFIEFCRRVVEFNER